MKKNEILKSIRIDKLDETTVFISNRYFTFAYTIADKVVKDEFIGQYRYFGGLQCDYDSSSPDYKNLESWLCEIAERILKPSLFPLNLKERPSYKDDLQEINWEVNKKETEEYFLKCLEGLKIEIKCNTANSRMFDLVNEMIDDYKKNF